MLRHHWWFHALSGPLLVRISKTSVLPIVFAARRHYDLEVKITKDKRYSVTWNIHASLALATRAHQTNHSGRSIQMPKWSNQDHGNVDNMKMKAPSRSRRQHHNDAGKAITKQAASLQTQAAPKNKLSQGNAARHRKNANKRNQTASAS